MTYRLLAFFVGGAFILNAYARYGQRAAWVAATAVAFILIVARLIVEECGRARK